MKPQDTAELLLLAAIWGASFLFMRVAAPAFGPLALAFVRVALASLVLLAVLLPRQGAAALRGHWRALAVVGALNSALPFALFSFAALHITAGLSSILNATAALWGAVVGWVWLREPLGARRLLGLALGFGGVVFLAWEQAGLKGGGSGWAVLACLAATLGYGVAAHVARQRLAGVAPLAVATGSQLAAALLLAPLALSVWPAAPPPAASWLAAGALAVACTSLAYLLYFRLIQRIGAARAVAVTFLIPVFAVLWGAVFLHEALTGRMLLGGAVVGVGTALALGVGRRR